MSLGTQAIRQILSKFFPSNSIEEYASFGAGNINDSYRVRICQNGSEELYLLQRLNHQVFKEPHKVMANIELVSRHLSRETDSSYLLKPVPDRQGANLYQDTDGNYWRVFPFFAGTFSSLKAENTDQAYQAAKMIGSFLRDLLNLDTGQLAITIPHFHDSLYRWNHFQNVVAVNSQNRLLKAQEEVLFLIDRRSLFGQIANLKLPERAVHNDAKINNVLFDQLSGEAVSLIDWDTIMPGTILSDFGDMVRSMINPLEEDDPAIEKVDAALPVFEALCRGFLSEIGDFLEPQEKENLVRGAKWITLEQTMRFLTDYLEGDVYYKIQHPEHNLFRTRNQIALFKSMEAKEKTMEEIVANSTS